MHHQPSQSSDPMSEFFRKGLAFIQSHKANGADPCCAIRPGTEEWRRWVAYFRDSCGALPRVMATVGRMGGPETFTVPAQWPEWFDGSYVEGVVTVPFVRVEPKRPMRLGWMKNKSWADITDPPPGGWVPDPYDEEAEAAMERMRRGRGAA